MLEQPRFGRIPDGIRRSGLKRGKLYELAAKNPGLFRKADAATIVDLEMLDGILAALPAAEIAERAPDTSRAVVTEEFPRLLAEIAVAENAAEIDAVARHATRAIALLPPQQRELANEKLQDAIRERRERDET
jgi:hypothetical protein